MKRLLLVFTVLVMFTACTSGGVKGTFTDESGLSVLTFKSGGKLLMTAMDVNVDMTYTFKDNKVKIIEPNGIITELEFDGKDTLTGPGGLKYTRKR